MGFFLRVACLAALLFDSSRHVTAQFSQDYQVISVPSTSGNGDTLEYFHQATPGAPLHQVIDLAPQSVFLVYNRYYMKDICYNAINFLRSPRGINLHPDSQLPSGQLGYDFNTGKDSTTHSTQRRDQSCPGTWKNNHMCPE
ncbi:hypothetical protein CSUB01_04531 [Colletotrichum sublineola]|uniref:Uncharacterized protein n=1 Tax=Colletotrichum sublineola TaxID=1173701 RepID=A0A066X1E0_COLSU|nr:hypothetical protein CSUB01_04531 [Colletotrichum sublineola]